MEIKEIFSLLSGLAFFLFGMTLLGEGLKRVAGSKMENILGTLIENKQLSGILINLKRTLIIQLQNH